MGTASPLRSSVVQLDDDVEVVSRYLYERGHTDGLPVVPPTRDRVARMLAGTTRGPAESLGAVPPINGEATIEKLAINAVMAGCLPEYLPILITAFELMLQPGFQLAGMQPTTNPLTPMLIVNGPIRTRIDLNCSTGVMGPGWQANATLGRAVRLALINLGGATPGEVDKCTQGFVAKYGLCIGENEEDSPWEPFHVTQGFAPSDSVVTVVGVNAAINIHDSSDDWRDVIKTFCGSLPSLGTPNVVDPHATPVLALNPLHARILHDGGFTRVKLQRHLVDSTRLPADALSNRRAHLRKAEGEELYLVDGRIPIVNDPNNLLVVVSGGMQGGHSCFLPAGHYGIARSAAVSP
jgi:hypothetical protein